MRGRAGVSRAFFINRKVNWIRIVLKWPETANSCSLTHTHRNSLLLLLLCDGHHTVFLEMIPWCTMRMIDGGITHNMLIKSIFLSDWTQKGRQTGFPFLFPLWMNKSQWARIFIDSTYSQPFIYWKREREVRIVNRYISVDDGRIRKEEESVSVEYEMSIT